jgi:hypothetical protein
MDVLIELFNDSMLFAEGRTPFVATFNGDVIDGLTYVVPSCVSVDNGESWEIFSGGEWHSYDDPIDGATLVKYDFDGVNIDRRKPFEVVLGDGRVGITVDQSLRNVKTNVKKSRKS